MIFRSFSVDFLPFRQVKKMTGPLSCYPVAEDHGRIKILVFFVYLRP